MFFTVGGLSSRSTWLVKEKLKVVFSLVTWLLLQFL